MNLKFYLKLNINKGFTLIELLVATSLFAIVAVGGLSVLLSSQTAYKRISNNRMAVDNINLVLDTLSREIKFGSNYGCINSNGNFLSSSNYNSFASSTIFGDSINNECNAVVFTPQGSNTQKVVYYLDTDKSTINEAEYDLSGGIYTLKVTYPITTQDLVLDTFWFNVIGTGVNDYLQPKVRIFVSGIIILNKDLQKNIIVSTTTFAAEVVSSQRILDN
ncbi:MAG: prepilin-type N-terminal cleavage/methylation domain-containing protein [Candidatus Pacebacteria bacterium]|nr:prepilin-type N-terminal cleavage/methylation domain-containing protein [Candidatus Paceibacterota bacterium]